MGFSDSVECYARAHGYQFILTHDKDWGCDYLNDVSLFLAINWWKRKSVMPFDSKT